MLLFALFVSSAMAMEIGLNMTGSGTAQSRLSTSSSSVTTSSAAETITEIIIPVSELSSASPTSSSSLSASPTVTDGPIYTNDCDSDEGRNCDRLPEMPYWFDGTPGNLVYGYTPTAQQNPWSYFFSFTVSDQGSSALASASSCSVAWYTNYTNWLATAPLTYGTVVPQTTTTYTLSDATATDVSYGSTTATATIITTETETYSGGSASTTTETDISYGVIESSYTTTQIATTETLIYTSYTAAFYPSYTWQAQPPCCSGCTIYAGDIEVMYFPPATAVAGNKTSSQPSTVVSSGFTFTSPSIYMALQTLAASDLCGQLGSQITSATTLSFAQDELSTVPAYSSDGSIFTWYPYWSPTSYYPATFGTASCTDVTTVTSVEDITATVSYNPCYPYISIPPQVQTADPLWATCTSQWRFLLYDPPYVISSGNGIGEFSSSSPASTTTVSIDPTTSPQAETTSSSVASTGPTPTAPTVAPTTTATLIPTTVSSASAQPSSTESSSSVDPTTVSTATAQSSPNESSTSVEPTTSTVVDPGNGQSTSVAVDPGNGQSTSVAADPGNGQSTSTAVSPSNGQSTSVAIQPGTGQSTSITTSPGTGASSSAAGAGSSPSGPAQTTPPVVIIGSSTITANSASGFVIGSTTLTPGGQVTVGGTTVSLASNGATIAVGSSTQALITSSTLTYIIGSQTLSAGGAPITVSGTTYSLESGGSSIIVGGTTQAISALIENSTPAYVVASGLQTLEAGGSAITVSGTVVSLQSEGSSVILGGTSTVALSAFLGSTTTSASGLGGIIATIGGFATSSTRSLTSSTSVSSNGTIFTGIGSKGEVGNVWMWGTILGAGIVAVAWL